MRMLGEAYSQAEAAKGKYPRTRLQKYCPTHLVEGMISLDWKSLDEVSDQIEAIDQDVWRDTIYALFDTDLDQSKLRGLTQSELADAFLRDELPASIEPFEFVGMIQDASPKNYLN